MQIVIHDNNLSLGEVVHKHALNRLVYELSNYDAQILSVVVGFSQGNDHNDIDYKFCKLRIDSDRFKEIIIEEKSSDFFTAIDIATDKARRITIGRIIQQNFYSGHNYSYSLT